MTFHPLPEVLGAARPGLIHDRSGEPMARARESDDVIGTGST
jgi:hypothetical protein